MAAPRFLFVHGAWHGAWSFDLLRLELERRAVSCEALDLPALGDDKTGVSKATFEHAVERLVARIGTRRNWTLVGHSLAGFHVTEAALRASGRVRAIVYLAAYVPGAGDDWETIDALAPATAEFKACITRQGPAAEPAVESEDEPAASADAPAATADAPAADAVVDAASAPAVAEGKKRKKKASRDLLVLDVAKAKDLLYHDVAPGIAAAACTRLRPQPVAGFTRAKIEGTGTALGRIPRTAIVAEDDRVLAADSLVALAERAGVSFELIDAGHCPFLSRPKRVADLLLGVR